LFIRSGSEKLKVTMDQADPATYPMDIRFRSQEKQITGQE
jgi:hypothetical protein